MVAATIVLRPKAGGLFVAIVAPLLGLILAGGARGAPSPRSSSLPARTLETIWPARLDCPRFEQIEIAVDERVDAVEWRGTGGRKRFEVSRPTDPKQSWVDFRKDSASLDGLGVMSVSQILYLERRTPAPVGTFRAARASEALPEDFPLGRLDHLVVHAGTLPPTITPRYPGVAD